MRGKNEDNSQHPDLGNKVSDGAIQKEGGMKRWAQVWGKRKKKKLSFGCTGISEAFK